MAIPGETVGTGEPVECPDCKKTMCLRVLESGAGCYLGYDCDQCFGPYSRETGYYATREEAEVALKTGRFEFRSTEFSPGPFTVTKL